MDKGELYKIKILKLTMVRLICYNMEFCEGISGSYLGYLSIPDYFPAL